MGRRFERKPNRQPLGRRYPQRGHRKGSPPRTLLSTIADQTREPSHHRNTRADVPMAHRQSTRPELPFLRQDGGAGPPLLRRTLRDGVSPEKRQRRVIIFRHHCLQKDRRPLKSLRNGSGGLSYLVDQRLQNIYSATAAILLRT